MAKIFSFGNWSISDAEIKTRLDATCFIKRGTFIEDVLFGDSEWEFTGRAYETGIAICDSESGLYVAFPTINEYRANEDLKDSVAAETDSDYRASHVSYHDLIMCFGILFRVESGEIVEVSK